MKDLTKIFIDLSKCSEEEQKHIISLLPEDERDHELYEVSADYYILTYHSINFCSVGDKSFKYGKTELTYPETNDTELYTKEDMEKAYRAGENKRTYYFKDTTVILPTSYEGVDG